MWAVFTRTIKDRRILLLVYILASIGLLWMYIALFPSFKDQSGSLEQLIKNYPESFMKAFNFDIKSFTTLEGYLSTEQFSFVWPLLVIFMTLGYSGYALSSEVEKGTIEILLSQPISRLKLFFGRYFAGLLMITIFTVFSVYAAIPLARAYNIDFNTHNFLTISILSFLFVWAIYSIGMFFSAVFSGIGRVYFVTGGILVLMYVLNIVSALQDNLADLKYASFFYYFNPQKALVYNQIDHWAYLVFGGTIVVCTLLGAIWFSKRDIAA